MSNLGSTGREWKIYRNTATYATPTWTQVAERKDISIGLSKDEIESLRDGAEFREYLPGFKDMTIEFPIRYTNANTNLVAFKDDFFGDTSTSFDLLILDGPQGTSGSQGIRAMVTLTGFDMSAGLAEESTVDLTFRPTYNTDGETDWFTVP